MRINHNINSVHLENNIEDIKKNRFIEQENVNLEDQEEKQLKDNYNETIENMIKQRPSLSKEDYK